MQNQLLCFWQEDPAGNCQRFGKVGGGRSNRHHVIHVPDWAAFFERLKNKVRFVSVQYGDTDDEIAFARWKYSVEIYQDKSLDIYNDVEGAAAQIAVMDYMVSIATTAAHLAGKLILHWRPGKKICPWYPTLRPIRQLATEDWKSVLTSVTEELVNELNVIDE
jgi:hypothetical protein